MFSIHLQLPTMSVAAGLCALIPVAPAVIGVILSKRDHSLPIQISSGISAGLFILTALSLVLTFFFPASLLTIVTSLLVLTLSVACTLYWIVVWVQPSLETAFIILSIVSLMAVVAFETYALTIHVLCRKAHSADAETALGQLHALMPTPSLVNGLTNQSPITDLSSSRSTSVQEKVSPAPPLPPSSAKIATHTRLKNKASQSSSLTLGDNHADPALLSAKRSIREKRSSSPVFSIFTQHGNDSGTVVAPSLKAHHHSDSSSLFARFPHNILNHGKPEFHSLRSSKSSKLSLFQQDLGRIPSGQNGAELTPPVGNGVGVISVAHPNGSSTSVGSGLDSWEVNSVSARERLQWTLANADVPGIRSVSDGSSRLSTKSSLAANQLNSQLNAAGFTKEEAIIENERRGSLLIRAKAIASPRIPSGKSISGKVVDTGDEEVIVAGRHKKQLSQYDLERLTRTSIGQ